MAQKQTHRVESGPPAPNGARGAGKPTAAGQPATGRPVSGSANGASKPAPKVTSEELLTHLVQALARVRQETVDETWELIHSGGNDLSIDSKQGETVIAILVVKLGCDLPGPSDLKREQLTSVRSLLALMENRLPPQNNAKGKSS